MNAIGILQAGRDYLMANGWVQGSGGLMLDAEGDGRRGCVMTACWQHLPDPDAQEIVDPLSAAQRYLRLTLEARGHDGGIIGWNDAPGRTFNEVMALFDEAILLAKETVDA